MDTTRKVISDVINSLKSITLDDRMSYRHVLSILNDKTRKFLKQDLDSRRIFKISESWKRIPCLHLREVDLMECGFDIPHCRKMMKSTKAIPEVFQSTYGNLIKLMTIDQRKELVQTTFTAYKNISGREYKNPDTVYFILLEGHIYIPDSEIEEVTVFGLFKHPFEVTKLIDPDSKCLKPLDENFPAPDYLMDAIKSDAKIELIKIYKPIVQDENPNLNTNIK